MSRAMLCNAALMVRLSNFYSSFKPNFSRIFCSSLKLFEHQTVRLSRVHCISIYYPSCYMRISHNFLAVSTRDNSWSLWPLGVRRRSAVGRLLRLWVRISPRAWMFVSCECCVLSGRGLCDELITRPEESYRLWCVLVCDLETSWMRRPWPTGGCCAKNKQI